MKTFSFQIEGIEHQVSEIQLRYKPKMLSKEPLRSSRDFYQLFRGIWSDHLEYIEEFLILLLNRSNKPIGFAKISSGGVSGTVVDGKVIFQAALLGGASSIILCHNHPSGNLKPSQADIDITRKLFKAGETLDITVLDHIIISSEGYYSFADEGRMS